MAGLVAGRASSSPPLQWLAVTLAHSGFGQKNRGGWGRRKQDSGLSGGGGVLGGCRLDAVRPPLGLVGNGGASWRQRLASVEANLRIEDMLVCRGGAGLVGSFLCQEDGETNRRWQGLPPLVFLAEANERLIWVYEGEAERGAVRGCLGYGEAVKTGYWEQGSFIGLLVAEIGERESSGWLAESFCFFSKKMGGSREDENGPGEKVADRSYVGEEKTKGKRLGGSSTRGNGAKLLLVLDPTKLKTPKRVGRRFLCR